MHYSVAAVHAKIRKEMIYFLKPTSPALVHYYISLDFGHF